MDLMDPRLPLQEVDNLLGKLHRQAKASPSLSTTLILDEISYLQNRVQAIRLGLRAAAMTAKKPVD